MTEMEIPLLEMYRTMLTIRRFEERCNYLYMQGRIPSTLHLYIGQEAVATGVCAHLRPDDYLFSTHRPHGHALAKGVTPREIMAELMAKGQSPLTDEFSMFRFREGKFIDESVAAGVAH